MRAQLGIEDDILRGLGMCLQQAKRARVRTRALLANLRHKLIFRKLKVIDLKASKIYNIIKKFKMEVLSKICMIIKSREVP